MRRISFCFPLLAAFVPGAGAGRVSQSHTSAGVAIPGGISLGLAELSVAGSARGTNAVFLERRSAL